MALLYGADAVYLGLTGFNARRTAGNFTPEQLAEVKDNFRRHLGERFTERITKRRR